MIGYVLLANMSSPIENNSSRGGFEEAGRERLSLPIETLRPVSERDLPILLRWFHDSAVLPHLIGISADTTVSDLRRYYKRSGVHGFVSQKDDGIIVGTVTFKDPDQSSVETFMRMNSAEMARGCVDPLRFHSGYGMRMTIKALDEQAFDLDALSYQKVAAGYIEVPGHEVMKHMLKKLGFREIGERLQEVTTERNGATTMHDVVLVELSREEWARRREGLIDQYLSPHGKKGGFFPFRR